MSVITLTLFLTVFWGLDTAKASPAYVELALNTDDPFNPGTCGAQSHGQIKLVKDRKGDDSLVVCTQNSTNSFLWKFLDGRPTVGEYFDPAHDCSDLVDKVLAVKDGMYWIKNERIKKVVKVWCDLKTDGGGYMLVAKKNNAITWTVPSSNQTVDPRGVPHWSSVLGGMKMLDIRIQFSTTPEFKDTKADWSFRLQNKRPFSKLLVPQNGCTEHNPGIGDISYVKDLLVGKIVNTNFRCSLFSAHLSDKIGWGKMNKCLQQPCPKGFAILSVHGGLDLKLDDHGSFSYSAYQNATSSGLRKKSTSFIGCSYKKCCACYGPRGGTENYCLKNCTAINGGTVIKNVRAWIWIRSSVPKRAWRKCTEYVKTDSSGTNQTYRLNEETGIEEKGSCAYSEEVKKSGSVLVAPNEKAVDKIPSVPGLLLYRLNNKKLFVQGEKQWNEIAMKKELQGVMKNEQQVLEQKLTNMQQQVKDLKGLIGTDGSCLSRKFLNYRLSNGVYTTNSLQVYCDMANGGWTLIARFSNADAKNWITNGYFWYSRTSSYGYTTNPYVNRDMISPTFSKIKANEFKLTRSDDSSHTALLQTTSNCLEGQTFRTKITSYGNFRYGAWASDRCRGNCRVSYSGQYGHTAGFGEHSCSSNIQRSNYIGFWCDWGGGDGSVMMIGGGGSGCYRADHGIGITEEDAAKFSGFRLAYDFGHDAYHKPPSSYSLNLWVR